ncbi:TPA: O-antigen polysaccharide polymerase Wzy, partial [Proteus mirabilis]|nr:O-antigen polysaccharide polymerase Wzy [Proteus mirabilis]
SISIILLILVQLNRQNWVFNSDLNYFKYFFISQGVSFYILPLTITYIEEFTNLIPSIFSSFSINSIIYTSQTIERLNNVGFLGDIISYNHLRDYYLNGNGLGGSFIAELYQAGIIISIIFSILLGFFINYFDTHVSQNRYFLAISFYVVSNIAYMPRSVFFKSPYMLISYFIIFLFLLSLPKITIFTRKN